MSLEQGVAILLVCLLGLTACGGASRVDRLSDNQYSLTLPANIDTGPAFAYRAKSLCPQGYVEVKTETLPSNEPSWISQHDRRLTITCL